MPWWKNETLTIYNEKVKCFVEQYNNFTIDSLGELPYSSYVNGAQTVDENIADVLGLQLAFQAFKESSNFRKLPGDIKGFSSEQLFFISFAKVSTSLNVTWGNYLTIQIL